MILPRLAFTFRQELIYNTICMGNERAREEPFMPRMYRVLAFWTGIFSLMGFVGGMPVLGLLFLGQAGMFFALSYLNLTERTYLYIFGVYLTLFMVGFSYWSVFMMAPGSGGH